MLGVVGLALDVVGAAVLAIGLFGNPTGLFPSNFLRTPGEAASDQASGITGLLFLASGFAAQATPALGWNPFAHDPVAARVAGCIALGVGAILAWLVYECVRRWRFSVERRWVLANLFPNGADDELPPPMVFRPHLERPRGRRWVVPRLWGWKPPAI